MLPSSLLTSTQPHRCATALIDYLRPQPDINWTQRNSMRWPHNMLCLCCVLDNFDSASTHPCKCWVRMVFRLGKPFNSEHDFPVHWPIRIVSFRGWRRTRLAECENQLGNNDCANACWIQSITHNCVEIYHRASVRKSAWQFAKTTSAVKCWWTCHTDRVCRCRRRCRADDFGKFVNMRD